MCAHDRDASYARHTRVYTVVLPRAYPTTPGRPPPHTTAAAARIHAYFFLRDGIHTLCLQKLFFFIPHPLASPASASLALTLNVRRNVVALSVPFLRKGRLNMFLVPWRRPRERARWLPILAAQFRKGDFLLRTRWEKERKSRGGGKKKTKM